MYPSQFDYVVSKEYRNDMIKELVQIQVYVKEMEEINDLPKQSDCTEVSLSSDNTRKN